MARYGSEAIRGHGMPEAIEAILRNGSKVRPRIALLKPVSAAITIGTGGPFGAEGPIIMTGGAFGSLMAQTLSLTADERKTLLVAGAAAGRGADSTAAALAHERDDDFLEGLIPGLGGGGRPGGPQAQA
jgi:CIC family chloride channel protein